MIYVLAYPVFEPISAERIDAFRAKHEPERAKLVPPHVTLVFGVADEHVKTVSTLVDRVSAKTEAFRLVFDKSVIEFDPFEKKHKLFLLCGDGSDRVRALHEELYDGPHSVERSAEHPFKPHMTVATYQEHADLEDIEVSALGEFPITAKLSALELVQFHDGNLTTLKTAEFTG